MWNVGPVPAATPTKDLARQRYWWNSASMPAARAVHGSNTPAVGGTEAAGRRGPVSQRGAGVGEFLRRLAGHAVWRRSGRQDDLDALVLFVEEGLEPGGRVVKAHPVGDDEARVELTGLNAFE